MDWYSFLAGSAVGAIGMIFFLAALVLVPRKYDDGTAQVSFPQPEFRVPDKIETPHEVPSIKVARMYTLPDVSDCRVIRFPGSRYEH